MVTTVEATVESTSGRAADELGPVERLGAWMSGYPDIAARRLLHKAPIALWRLGFGPVIGRPLMLLTTTGRASGIPRRTPLTTHRIGGRMYAWNPYGERSNWWRNLVADPIVTVQDAGGPWTARAVRLDSDAEAAEVCAALRQFDPRLYRASCDGLGIADTVEAFVANRERVHVARLVPVPGSGPSPAEADLAWMWVVVTVVLAGMLAIVRLRR